MDFKWKSLEFDEIFWKRVTFPFFSWWKHTQRDEKSNQRIFNKSFERIPLTFIDSYDLMSAFGNILFINQFQRFQGGMNGGRNGFGGGRNF